MVCKMLALFLFTLIGICHGGILFWSSAPLLVSPLREFTNESMRDLAANLGNPEMIVFRTHKMEDVNYLVESLTDCYAVYVPKSSVNFENAKDLPEDVTAKIELIGATNNSCAGRLLALEIKVGEKPRIKRRVAEAADANETDTTVVDYIEPSDAVMYAAKSKEGVEAMVHSSKPPLLRTGNNIIYLGKSTGASIDNRDSYTRLIVTIPISNGKVTLRFKFPWVKDNWYLSSVEYLDPNAKNWNLTLNQELAIPRHFSYHCGGALSFVDLENDIELILFNIQVQPDATNRRFSDVWNCVPFTTGPIWSGLFVTWILLFALGVGLGALNSIHTMDKFDNNKTKQLTITVSE